MDIKKFEVGKTYECEALYGGEEVIRVVGRTNTTISYVYTDDEQNVKTENIIMQNTYDTETGSICGKGETIIAWEYIPCCGRYGNDKFYGYFMA